MTPAVDTSIKPGDEVRSWDFPHNLRMDGVAGQNVRGCYIEGPVQRLTRDEEGCPSYEIKVERSFYQGKPWVYDPPVFAVLIPQNGTKDKCGRINCHVVRL